MLQVLNGKLKFRFLLAKLWMKLHACFIFFIIPLTCPYFWLAAAVQPRYFIVYDTYHLFVSSWLMDY